MKLVRLAIAMLSVLMLSGCGLKMITQYEVDRHCYGCQAVGYAKCAADKKEGRRIRLNQDETEEILSILDDATAREIAKGKKSIKDDIIFREAGEAPIEIEGDNGMLLNLTGYRRLD